MTTHVSLSDSPFALRPSKFVGALTASACAPQASRPRDASIDESAPQVDAVQAAATDVAVERLPQG